MYRSKKSLFDPDMWTETFFGHLANVALSFVFVLVVFNLPRIGTDKVGVWLVYLLVGLSVYVLTELTAGQETLITMRSPRWYRAALRAALYSFVAYAILQQGVYSAAYKGPAHDLMDSMPMMITMVVGCLITIILAMISTSLYNAPSSLMLTARNYARRIKGNNYQIDGRQYARQTSEAFDMWARVFFGFVTIAYYYQLYKGYKAEGTSMLVVSLAVFIFAIVVLADDAIRNINNVHAPSFAYSLAIRMFAYAIGIVPAVLLWNVNHGVLSVSNVFVTLVAFVVGVSLPMILLLDEEKMYKGLEEKVLRRINISVYGDN